MFGPCLSNTHGNDINDIWNPVFSTYSIESKEFEQVLKFDQFLNQELTADDYICDEYFTANGAKMNRGIRGLKSGVFYENVLAKYVDSGDALSSDQKIETEWNLGGQAKLGYITSDIYTTFTLLIGIFFPSCTGMILLA